jgi:hypothetical protein
MDYPTFFTMASKISVTGSRHQLLMDIEHSLLLIDYGLFQGASRR